MSATDHAEARRIVRRCYLGNVTVTDLRSVAATLRSICEMQELNGAAFYSLMGARTACRDAARNRCQFTLREAGAAVSQALAFC